MNNDFFDEEWSTSGIGSEELYETIRKFDNSTKTMQISTNCTDVLSWVGKVKDKEGDTKVAFHVLNKGTLDMLSSRPVYQFEPVLTPEEDIRPFLKDWRKTKCLFRYFDTWFCCSDRIFNCFGGGAGQRFASLTPGFPRNLTLCQTFHETPEELTLILRGMDGYWKAFSANRGAYKYESQQFFVDNIVNYIKNINKDGSHWEITNWEITHFLTKVCVEDKRRNSGLNKAGITVTPLLRFTTSATGDSSLLAEACLKQGDAINRVSYNTHKHTKYLFLEDFFDECVELPNKLDSAVCKLEALKFVPSENGLLTRIVTEITLSDNRDVGKKEVQQILEKEVPLSDAEDKTAYDVVIRILSMPQNLTQKKNAEKLTGSSLDFFDFEDDDEGGRK